MSKRRTISPIDVIEAAYDLDLEDTSWLRNLASAVYPLLDGGCGACAYYYDAALSPDKWLAGAVLLDYRRAYLRHSRRLVATDNKEFINDVHTVAQPLESTLQAARDAGHGDLRRHPPFAEFLRATRARDYIVFRTIEPGGKGIAVSAGQSRERNLDSRTQQLWARVAAHVAAARRLRSALVTDAAPTEVVLTTAGRVEHADGLGKSARAREALRQAVLRQEKARGPLRRRDPEAATEMWTALIGGRWSLIDRFERGGRRYFIAKPNDPALPNPRALTTRERAVVHLAALGKPLKLIAYELGLGESTVSTHLAAAMRKLGVRSRVELVRLAAQLHR